ncbi:MAG: D-alanyl-D-alanine carboxypeptidase (penicillin-binding protein 5/6) [Verrucomicrobia bacterium]|nr:MAG: D-alanyl-D-alanine carboxypeptidase (penicillin-binding protein 5/6) [Verrucomicrobiota bacterium]
MRLHRLLFLFLCLLFLPAPASNGADKKKPAPARQSKPTPKPKPAPPPKKEAEEEEDDLDLAAKGAIVIDALTGDLLYQKNPDTRFYPASTTKIMTGLLIIEAGHLDQTVEITPEDARVGESSLNIHAGETFTRRQMLFGLLLKSANDVAAALGRDNGGSIEAFAQKMTARAQELGCTNTQFANPHGLHHIAHFTTPRDLALIARAAMNQPLFRQIVGTKQAHWEAPSGLRLLTNHNRLLDRFPGCTGIKTGYTIPAQQVLASSAYRNGREAIAVVMHTDKPGIWEDSAKLLEFGLTHTLENVPVTGR